MSYSRRWGQTGGGEAKPKVKSKQTLALWIAVGAAIAVLAVWRTASSGSGKAEPDSQEPVKDAKRITEAKPAKAKPRSAPDPLDDPKWDGLDKSRVRKTANGEYVYLPRIGEERFPGERAQALALIGGTNHTAAIDKRLVEDPEHPWMFHNMVQSDLVQYARPGEFAVPVNPNITDEQAWEAINSPIEFHYNDTDTQLEEKQFVKDMMAELKEYMEKGGHARDYFAQFHHRQEMEAEIMLKTRQEVHDILNSGDVDGARQALEVYNAYRKEKGLPAMRIRKLNGPKNVPVE